MMEDLISVVIPVFNGEKYIKDISDALIAQTYKNLEIIVVDDGSKDNTLKLCYQYMTDERFHIYHKENEGVSTARNYGKEMTTGEYIAFVDVDDYIFPTFFEYLYKLISDYDAEMSCCGYYKIWDFKPMPQIKERGKIVLFTAEEAVENLCYSKVIMSYPWLKLIKREVLQNVDFPDGICYGEDTCFTLRAIHNCQRIAYGSQKLYVYYQHSTSAMHNIDICKLAEAWPVFKRDVLYYSDYKNPRIRDSAYVKLFVRATEWSCHAVNQRGYESFKRELIAFIKKYDKIVFLNKNCKKMYRLLAAISCVNTSLMINVCRGYFVLKDFLKK